jgi:hypothetical protein
MGGSAVHVSTNCPTAVDERRVDGAWWKGDERRLGAQETIVS